MNRHFATAALCTALAAGTAPGPRDADEREIRRLLAQTADGWNRADARAIAEVYAEDADHIGVTGGWKTGRAEVERELVEAFKRPHKEITLSVEKVRFLGPDTAVAIARREYRTDKEARK